MLFNLYIRAVGQLEEVPIRSNGFVRIFFILHKPMKLLMEFFFEKSTTAGPFLLDFAKKIAEKAPTVTEF